MPGTSARRLLWLVVALGLGLTTGPGGVSLLALLALLSLWWPSSRAVHALVALGLACCAATVTWLLSPAIALVLAALAAVDLIARDRERALWGVGAAAVVLLGLGGLALAGPRPPVAPLWAVARVTAALLVLLWTRRHGGEPGDARGPLLATATCGALVLLRLGLWSAGAAPLAATPTAVEPRWVEGARLGLRQRVAGLFRDEVCRAVSQGDRRGAVRALAWGGSLAPAALSGAEALLWKVSLIAPGDPAQAQRLATRVFSAHSDAQVVAGARPRARTLVLQLAEWSEQAGRAGLTEALVVEAQRPAAAGSFTRCPQPL